MIAIKSEKKLLFPPASVGYVTMEIDLIQNKPKEGVYELRIIDTCTDNVLEKISVPNEDGTGLEEKEVEVVKTLGTNVKFKTYTYEELAMLGKILQLKDSDFPSLTDYINELFRQGLLITTQQECQKGISGEGRGMYFSEAQDWEIIK